MLLLLQQGLTPMTYLMLGRMPQSLSHRGKQDAFQFVMDTMLGLLRVIAALKVSTILTLKLLSALE